MSIKVLSENIINKIAAGEVIERPANVVKELVDNAIDAGATIINVSVKGFGIDEIIVEDNGSGISGNELPLVFKRHATSKIKKESDLTKIGTLGFRGEAIPAIAEVSEVYILSKVKNRDGNFLKVSSGKIIAKGKKAAKDGTKIIVKNLFYNTPARYKYLKSENTEKRVITDFLRQFAISNPKIRFSLSFDGNNVLKTYGEENPKDLVSALYGNNFTKNLIKVKSESAKIGINLILLSPDFTRSQKRDITVIINGRFVSNYLIRDAIIDGYSGYLMTNKYPIAICYIKIDPYLVDVNIHPQKLTVKLVNEYALKAQITIIIRDALVSKYKKFAPNIFQKEDDIEILDYRKNEQLETKMANIFLEDKYENIKKYEINLFETQEIIKKDHFPKLEYLGQFHKTYLIFQATDGLYLMDQHAACERVNYEKFLKDGIDLKTQTEILFPYLPNLKKDELEIIKQNRQYFARYGFIINDRGEITKYPLVFKDTNLDFIMEYLLEMLNVKTEPNFQEVFSNNIADKSCKASVRANQELSLEEIESLLEDLRNCDNPYHCPHGRPTTIKFSKYDIEKLFKRIVS